MRRQLQNACKVTTSSDRTHVVRLKGHMNVLRSQEDNASMPSNVQDTALSCRAILQLRKNSHIGCESVLKALSSNRAFRFYGIHGLHRTAGLMKPAGKPADQLHAPAYVCSASRHKRTVKASFNIAAAVRDP